MNTINNKTYLYARFLFILFLLAFAFNALAEPVNLNNAPVRSFVQWYSQKTGRAVIVNPNKVMSHRIATKFIQPVSSQTFCYVSTGEASA
ncbi:hypothetical protein NUG10_000069 [Yersinia enterocolitica]|nr:hypothetical protein [Yersinia enterocolitica]ELW7360063.1 hypothetical protein [Yersinia enterocolitica]